MRAHEMIAVIELFACGRKRQKKRKNSSIEFTCLIINIIFMHLISYKQHKTTSQTLAAKQNVLSFLILVNSATKKGRGVLLKCTHVNYGKLRFISTVSRIEKASILEDHLQ